MTKQKKYAWPLAKSRPLFSEREEIFKGKKGVFKVSFFFFLSHLQTQGTITPPKGRGSATNSSLIHTVR
jgi:hypothetical protein